MHVKPEERTQAFSTLSSLLAPGGQMAMSLRMGQPDLAREMYEIDVEQLKNFAKSQKMEVTLLETGGRTDLQQRSDVHWGRICFKKGHEREEPNKAITAALASKSASR